MEGSSKKEKEHGHKQHCGDCGRGRDVNGGGRRYKGDKGNGKITIKSKLLKKIISRGVQDSDGVDRSYIHLLPGPNWNYSQNIKHSS